MDNLPVLLKEFILGLLNAASPNKPDKFYRAKPIRLLSVISLAASV